MTETAIQPGSYICVQTGTFLGRIIRWATHSPYDHAAIVIGGDQVIEATPYDVRIAPLAEYAGRAACANLADPVTGLQRVTIVARAKSFIGDEYNWADIAAIGLADLGLMWRALFTLPVARKALICSQLVALCGQAAGLDWLCGHQLPGEVTPADLARRPGVREVTIS